MNAKPRASCETNVVVGCGERLVLTGSDLLRAGFQSIKVL